MMNWYGGGEPHHMAELRRLFTTFGYLVANQGAVSVIGLAYWAVVTHLFGSKEVGLSAAAASTAILLAAFGGLGIPLLLLAEIESVDVTERRVFFTTGNAIAAFVVLIMAIATIALSLVYFDQRVRKEAFDLQLMMAAVDGTLPPGAQAASAG